MFHQFLPIIPLTLAGAFFFRRKSLAYGFPILLILLKVLLTQPSPIFFFTGGSLLFGVYLLRNLKESWGNSLWALAGYAFIAVLAFEVFSNFGVWIIGGCVPNYPPRYAHTFSGLVQCYHAALPYSAVHFLRDVPLTVLLIGVLSFLRKLDVSKAGDWIHKTTEKSRD